MHFFHKWGKWVVESDRKLSYTTIIGASGICREVVQVRECAVCGLKQYKTTDID